LEDIYRKDPLDLIDLIAIRLELIEREVSELASGSGLLARWSL